MGSIRDIRGMVFGSWTAVERMPSKDNRAMWLCECVCGKRSVVSGHRLRNGLSRSCGCARSGQTKHGYAGRGEKRSAEYYAWINMRDRCGNPNNDKYKWYGARGIRVCERWKLFENFIADMGCKPSAKHSLDRINVNGNYEPSNCRWATKQEQIDNRRPYGKNAARQWLKDHGLQPQHEWLRSE